MKKVINGKMYNTETATLLGGMMADFALNDFNYYYEDLYRKKTGEYFLYGEGNGASKYAKHTASGYTHGEDITPLKESEAKKWVERYLDADDYVEIFGEVEE